MFRVQLCSSFSIPPPYSTGPQTSNLSHACTKALVWPWCMSGGGRALLGGAGEGGRATVANIIEFV